MSGHTKGPWSYRRADGIESPSSEDYKIFSDDGALVAETFELIGKHRATDHHANARRIVACVNACAGIPDEKLESWMSPPEGQLGAPHGTWARQLFEVGEQLIQLQRERNELLMLVKRVYRKKNAEYLDLLSKYAGTKFENDPVIVSVREWIHKADELIEKAEGAA